MKNCWVPAMCQTLCPAWNTWQTKCSLCLSGSHAKHPHLYIHTIHYLSGRTIASPLQIPLMDPLGKQNLLRAVPQIVLAAECFSSEKGGQYWYFGHRFSLEKEGRLSSHALSPLSHPGSSHEHDNWHSYSIHAISANLRELRNFEPSFVKLKAERSFRLTFLWG